MAMRSTSRGSCSTMSPFRLNIATMVSSNATSVSGLIFGMKRSSYHAEPLRLIRILRVRKPARNGIPR
ncbi:hypothetical protein D3C72_2345590 [compost metagenome]